MSVTQQSERRAAVVTGSASGMGLATAGELVKQGWDVIGVDRDVSGVEAQSVYLGPGFHPCAVDVTDKAAVDAAIRGALPADAPLRAVVNAAGIYPPTTLDDFTEEQYRRIFDVNVLGLLNVTAACAPHMREHGQGGAVVNFASVDAYAVSLGQLLYSASKAAVVAITRYLAAELAGDGIVVNGVAPGWVDTPRNRATGRMEAALAAVPLKRAATAEEIAQWVTMLCDGTSYMTGEMLVISGGLVMR